MKRGKAKENVGAYGTLHCMVASAEDLLAADTSGKSDPYVLLKYDKMKHQTATRKGTLNPEWFQSFSFRLAAPPRQPLEISLWDWDRVGEHDSLGSAAVQLQDAIDECVAAAASSFFSTTRRIVLDNTTSGSLNLIFTWQTNDNDALLWPGGTLLITFIRARKLVQADAEGFNDPYVSASYHADKFSTKARAHLCRAQHTCAFTCMYHARMYRSSSVRTSRSGERRGS